MPAHAARVESELGRELVAARRPSALGAPRKSAEARRLREHGGPGIAGVDRHRLARHPPGVTAPIFC
jgi:hypothetical protein